MRAERRSVSKRYRPQTGRSRHTKKKKKIQGAREGERKGEGRNKKYEDRPRTVARRSDTGKKRAEYMGRMLTKLSFLLFPSQVFPMLLTRA